MNRIAFTLILWLSTALSAYAAIPRQIAYQGILTDTAGNPLQGTYALTISLYDAENASSSIWSEVHTEVLASQGMFALVLGSVEPLTVAFDTPYWIGVKVDGGEETAPRIRLSSAAYALRAEVADSAAQATHADSGEYSVFADTAQFAAIADSAYYFRGIQIDENGRLGINTAPDEQYGFLHLRQPDGGSGYEGFSIEHDTSTLSMRLWVDDAGTRHIGNGASPVVSIDHDKNVTIPRKLNLINGAGMYVSPNDSSFDSFIAHYIGTYLHDGKHLPLAFRTSSKTRMVISDNGNIGIGTSDPGYKLDVHGRLAFSGGGSQNYFMSNLVKSDSRAYTQYISHGGIAINGNDGNQRQMFMFTDGYSTSNIFTVATSDNAGESWINAFAVTGGGDVSLAGCISSTEQFCTSDRRYKQNITPIASALEKVEQLTGVTYDWKKEAYPEKQFTDDRQVGLVAQDVETVLPELVHTDQNGYKSLSYDKMTAVLVQAVKELSERNKLLQREIETLKSSLAPESAE